jgi:hypothetical protein
VTIFSGSNKIKTSLITPRRVLLPLHVIGSLKDIAPQPTRLILPTTEIITKFQRDGLTEEFDLETGERFMSDLFEHLTYEQEAELMLGVFAQEMAYDVTCGEEAERLLRHIVYLGQQLQALLKAYKLYQQGYLFHQFVQWWGHDIMVGDFRVLDLEPEDE